MKKKDYFINLEEIINSTIYFSRGIIELKKEIQENNWSIGISSDLTKIVDENDFLLFLRKVKENCKKQLKQSDFCAEISYYLWFDEQSGNLNFNFINTNHKNLPFKIKLDIVDSESIIIKDFLKSKYVNGISFKELNGRLKDESKESRLKVYKENIN